MTLSVLSNGVVQDTVVYPLLFIAGVIVKVIHGWTKKNTSSNVIDALSKDYQATQLLLNSKIDELKRKDEVIAQISKENLEIRGRIKSYENFLQSRTLETDQALKNIPTLLNAIADHLQVPLPTTPSQAAEAAHSQSKTYDSRNS